MPGRGIGRIGLQVAPQTATRRRITGLGGNGIAIDASADGVLGVQLVLRIETYTLVLIIGASRQDVRSGRLRIGISHSRDLRQRVGTGSGQGRVVARREELMRAVRLADQRGHREIVREVTRVFHNVGDGALLRGDGGRAPVQIACAASTHAVTRVGTVVETVIGALVLHFV